MQQFDKFVPLQNMYNCDYDKRLYDIVAVFLGVIFKWIPVVDLVTRNGTVLAAGYLLSRSKINLCKILPTKTFISFIAKFCPMQFLETYKKKSQLACKYLQCKNV